MRIHIDRSKPVPDPTRYLHPPCFDADDNPVYFGSAILDNVVQPCKVTLKVDELVCVVPHRLVERVHTGPFTILPFTDVMHLVPTSHGHIPAWHRPVEGGVDGNGRPLYHAVAWVRGERVPGRTSEHLGAAAVLLGGREHYVYDAHEILCWRDDVEVAPKVGDRSPKTNPDVNIEQPQGTSTSSGKPRLGGRDLAGMNLRVTVSNFSQVTPYPAARDFDGTTALYFGSALLDNAVLPGMVVEMRTCQVIRDGTVSEGASEFSVLPFRDDMELVPTSRGALPPGRQSVEGNYDDQGRKLYHAMLYVVGRQFPGMCAEHLGGAQGVLQGRKYTLETGYTILCWEKKNTVPDSVKPLAPLPHEDDPAGQRLRIPLNGNEELTTAISQNFGDSPIRTGSESTWFFASAFHDGCITPCWAHVSAQPCKYVRGNEDTVTVSTGPYCVLPFSHDRMELVGASGGVVPAGRTPVEGGRDEDGRPLYHAIGHVDGGPMIGMAAEHLGGAVILCQFGGVHRLPDEYKLLCWKT